MVHPQPHDAWRAAWFAWLIGKPYDAAALPPLTAAFETYKRERRGALPPVPFQMLTALVLGCGAWTQIAADGSWQQVRQNLNTTPSRATVSSAKTNTSAASPPNCATRPPSATRASCRISC